ncbi:hypothetical protein PROFUN_08255 [Planoprotostelium fungivorum]|uniref:Uncharacterized protein n=1 Tax=Planoprotostelium fungivorum TaxID=1890364 RepID=A0A2P6NK99_9EUKA|nr:hypothetical protein PROFUN_08255 [Planoprotostelium fungivorum]
MLSVILLLTLTSSVAGQFALFYNYPNASCTGTTKASSSALNICTVSSGNAYFANTSLSLSLNACTQYPDGFDTGYYFAATGNTFSRAQPGSADTITETYNSNTSCSASTFVETGITYGNGCSSSTTHGCRVDTTNGGSTTVSCGSGSYAFPTATGTTASSGNSTGTSGSTGRGSGVAVAFSASLLLGSLLLFVL